MKIITLKDGALFDKVHIKEDRRVISVFLKKNENRKKSNFHCIGCGYIRFQYGGDIDSIFDGAAISEDKAEIDVLCKLCGLLYRVM